MAVSFPSTLWILVAFVVGFFIVPAVISPLRSVPGPFLARFTRLWFLYRVVRGRFDLYLLSLHRKLGPIVRYGPYHYSFSDPEAIQIIYGKGTEFDKSSSYTAWNAPGFTTLFTEPSVKEHGALRRKFQSTFSMTSMVTYESFANQCIDLVCTRLMEVANGSGESELYRWMRSYAGDAVSMVTYSKRMGFLDNGEDVGNFFKNSRSNQVYGALVGIVDDIHPLIYNFSAFMAKYKLTAGTPRMFISRFNSTLIAEKRAERASSEKTKLADTEMNESAPKDFLSKFLDSNERDPSWFTERDINVGLVSNIVAGSDTTAATLTATLYHLFKHPRVFAKLRSEIDSAVQEGKLSSPPTFKEARDLNYLQAVIQEALRISPPIGMPIPRVVPPSGYEICGRWFPAGTVVSIHPLVINLDTSIFGDDVAEFRPERWLDLDKDTLSKRQRYMTTFGLGSRTCIGQHLAMLEMTKLVPQLVRKFDFELTGGLEKEGTELQWDKTWFSYPRPVPVKVKVRQE